jgi:hypothetical protein
LSGGTSPRNSIPAAVRSEYLVACAAKSGLPVGKGRAGVRGRRPDPDLRARALYERLGYVAYGSEPDGSIRRHETTCVLMRKPLT